MANYVLPQVLVFQEFRTVPAVAAQPLRAHVSGGHAYLLRFDEPAERPLGRLGVYDRLLDATYDWPHQPAGSKVDLAYAKLWVKDALLEYFSDSISAGSAITKLAGYSNRVRSDSVNFAANGTTYPRSALLLDRDVRPGDVAKVRGVTSGGSVDLWTYVKAVLPDAIAGVVAAEEDDAANPSSQSASHSVTFVSGDLNCVTMTASHAAYDGLPSGDIDETYDVLVTESSAGGDFTTARLRVISGSGRDDQASVTPSAYGVPTAIGTRGLTVTFSTSGSAACSASATSESVSAVDLIAGQRWQVVVHDDFTPATAASGGTYTGAASTTYVVEVTRGGLFASSTLPQISCSTVNGIDISGPTTVTASGAAAAAGTKGVTITFTGAGLRRGDRYYVPVTGTGNGPKRVIELGHSLDADIPDGSEVDLTLFIRRPALRVPADRVGAAPLTNWDADRLDGLTVHSGITAFDETWTDGGTPVALDVWGEASQDYGVLYAEYRAWLPTHCGRLEAIADAGVLDDALAGPLDPDNPLKYGVFKALENANGVEVKFTAVCDPDDDASWADALEAVVGKDDVYGLVPLTRRKSVLDLYHAHVLDQSSAEQALWRVLWTSLAGVPLVPVVADGSDVPNHAAATTTDGEVALATVGDDPQASGTQYTLLRCSSGNAAFLTNGVRAGDVVRIRYVADGFGGVSYSEYLVDEAVSEDELRLQSGPETPVTVGVKFEVWRNLSATEEAAEIARYAGAWDDRRVRAVWPDSIENAGTVVDGVFVACSLAGLSSGVLPHQGLTRLQVAGYTAVPRTTTKFNKTQLDLMAASGVWVVTQDINTGEIFSRQAVTTAPYADVKRREEMVTRNVDSLSFRFKEQFAPFIGVTNVTPVMEARIDLETRKLVAVLQTEGLTNNLGPQLIDATIVSVGPSALFADRIVLALDLVLPVPLNNLEVHLAI